MKLIKVKNNIDVKYLFNTIWLLSEKSLQIITNFIVVIFLSRYLGPNDYGAYTYSQSFIGMFLALSTLGLEVVLVKELVKGIFDRKNIIGTALVLKFTASSFSSVIILLIIYFNLVDAHTEKLIIIMLGLVFFNNFSLAIDTYFQSEVKSKITSKIRMYVSIMVSLSKLYLIYLGVSIEYFCTLLTAESLIIFFLYIRALKSYTGDCNYKLHFSFDVAKVLIKTSWPMMLVALSVFIYTKIDRIMIGNMLGVERVGYYSAAVKLCESFYFIPILITQSIFPKIIKLRNDGNMEGYCNLIENLYRTVFYISLPITLLLLFCNHEIINIIYGGEFEPASDILKVLSLSLILVSIGSVNTKILYAENYEYKYLKRSILGVVVNITMNYLLIVRFGATGAAYATIISLIVIHYIYDVFDKDLMRFYKFKIRCFWPRIRRNK